MCTGTSDRRSCQFVCVQGHRVCVYRVIRSCQFVCMQGHRVCVQGYQIDHVCVCVCVCVQGHCVCAYRVIRQVKTIMSVCVCTRSCVYTGSSDM